MTFTYHLPFVERIEELGQTQACVDSRPRSSNVAAKKIYTVSGLLI